MSLPHAELQSKQGVIGPVYFQNAEAFNALNHANFRNPRDASVGSPAITSGVFGTYQPPRWDW